MTSSVSTSLRGFTILELLAAMTILGLLLAASVPSTIRFYESMQYRQAIRDVVTTLGSARYKAVNSGVAQDVSIDPEARVMAFRETEVQIPQELTLAIHSAAEVNTRNTGVIRFYPEGGSSGGGIDLQRPDGSGVRIAIDWLAGRVTHEAYAVN